jgi:hypothetical protein
VPRRLFALVLTVAVMSAPLSLALCQVECADAAARRDQPVQHSCHESGEPAAVSMTAVPHACGHTDEAPAGLEHAAQSVTAPPAVMPVVAWAAPSSSVAPASAPAAADTSPPLSNRLIPLRI